MIATNVDIWRHPAVESHDFPGLCVHDGRVTGSITAGCTRLPLWCFIGTAVTEGWQSVESNWTPSQYGWDASRVAGFLYDLLEQRGEFARLLCILADVERREYARGVVDMSERPWWHVKSQRRRVIRQLRRCLDSLEAIDKASG